MKHYLPSTKEEPLRFFITFLNKASISRFENNFYFPNCPINPSFTSNKDEGFISYLKDVAVNEESLLVKIYYDTELSRLIDKEANISISFLEQRNNELLYHNANNDKYLQNQKIELVNLKIGIAEDSITIESLESNLDKIEDCIEKLLKGVTPKIQKISHRITANSFFGLKENYRIKHLIKLYDKSLELDIFDDVIVSEELFIDVFTASDPKPDKIIQFKANNLIAVHYLHLLSPAFENLNHARLTKSKLFYNRRGKLLYQGDFDNAYSRLKSKRGAVYDRITAAVNSVIL